MYQKMKITLIASNLILFIFSCQHPQKKATEKESTHTSEKEVSEKRAKPLDLNYELKNAKEWLLQNDSNKVHQAIVFAINRVDRTRFLRMDSVLVPTDLSYELAHYLPFPLEVDYLKDIHKIIYFSYPTQAFAAYENGVLIYTGPTSMGSKKHPTPTGLFYANWKSKKKVSTVNPEWVLHWNFNIINRGGIGWHQYELPGVPASHSCLRLLSTDAKYLYYWADQWELSEDFHVVLKGTPVIVFGSYDFDAPKPWLQLVANSQALEISESELQKITEPFFNEIMETQTKRDSTMKNLTN